MKKNDLLNENTKRLLAYSSAAGLGAFFADQTAEATVIRGSDLGFMGIMYTSPGSQYDLFNSIFLDVDNDTTNDFQFTVYTNPATADSVQIKSITNSVQILTSSGTSYSGSTTNPVSAFALNQVVDSNAPLVDLTPGNFPEPWLGWRDSMDINNDFSTANDNYLGVRGSSGSYAWVRLQIDMSTLTAPSLTVTEYAYESVPGMGIVVPEPSTFGLGLLALGALGMNVRRHRKAS